jgi:hypothetical protein
VTPCNCQYLSWGLWAGTITYSANSVFNASGQDTGVAFYVAGNLTNAVQLPNTGSATYTGHMIGVVNNGGSLSAAAGSYNNTVA